MKLTEYEGKRLFSKYGIAIPKSVYIKSKVSQKEFNELISKLATNNLFLKLQVLSGKRWERGAVRVVSRNEAYKQFLEMLSKNWGEPTFGILIEEELNIDKHFYLSIYFDRGQKNFITIFSDKIHLGHIEDLPPKYIKQALVKDVTTDFFGKYSAIYQVYENLKKLVFDKDILLAEINSIARLKNGIFIATDSKVIVDNNALFRHPEFTKIKRVDTNFVKLDGRDVGIIGNGAGLTMASLDIVTLVLNQKPANFLDIGGGANKEKIYDALVKVYSLKPKVIWLNIFGGITDTLEVAKAIVEFKDKNPNAKLVIRIKGNNQDNALRLLKSHRISATSKLKDAINILKDINYE